MRLDTDTTKTMGNWRITVLPGYPGEARISNAKTGKTFVTTVISFPVGWRVGKTWSTVNAGADESGSALELGIPERVTRAADAMASRILI